MAKSKGQKLHMHELERKTAQEFSFSDKLPVVVLLDNVRSLHNVGSVFRTADAFSIERIILCGITAQPPHRDIQKPQFLPLQNSKMRVTELSGLSKWQKAPCSDKMLFPKMKNARSSSETK